jgi:hypothetical protein
MAPYFASGAANLLLRFDKPILEPLMVSFLVKMNDELTYRLAQRCLDRSGRRFLRGQAVCPDGSGHQVSQRQIYSIGGRLSFVNRLRLLCGGSK